MRVKLWRKDPQQHAPSGNEIVNGQRSWAVIIGINAYPDAPLSGALIDVDAFHHYLVSVLGIPEDHIVTLLDGNATRDRIMDTLYEFLCANERIKSGDTIVVYFSGHGTSYVVPESELEHELEHDARHFPAPNSELSASSLWDDLHPVAKVRTVEALIPFDFGPDVPGISGRELNVCLADIRDKKGPNITVVLDCCYAGGATRKHIARHPGHTTIVGDQTCQVRYLNPPVTSYTDLLDDVSLTARRARFGLAPLAIPISMSHWRPDMTSHVLLAACRENELARDSCKGGWFTMMMLKLLTEHQGLAGLSNGTLTYKGLVGQLNPPSELSWQFQHPIVLGEYADSPLFQIGSHPRARLQWSHSLFGLLCFVVLLQILLMRV